MYGGKYFTRHAIHVWCKKFAAGRESVDEQRPERHVSTTDAMIAAVDCLVRPDQHVSISDIVRHTSISRPSVHRIVHNHLKLRKVSARWVLFNTWRVVKEKWWAKYEARSINKLQNGAIPLILKIGKIRNIRFVGNLILKIHINFCDDDVIIVTSSVHRTQSICVLFSPPVFYHNSQ